MERDLQNVEIRVRRLEQMHIWATGILAVGLVYLVVTNYKLSKK
jgi:hypothetical protein